MSFEWINPTRYPAPMLLRLATPEEIAGVNRTVMARAVSAFEKAVEAERVVREPTQLVPTAAQLQHAYVAFCSCNAMLTYRQFEAMYPYYPHMRSFVEAELAKCAPTPGQKAA